MDANVEREDDPEERLEEELEEARKTKRELRALIESKGWAILRNVVESQTARRKDNLLKPATPDTVWELEFQKGECSGMMLVIALVDTLIAASEVTIKRAAEEKDELNGTQHPSSIGTGGGSRTIRR